jgi:hypothetical protein
MYNSKQIRDGPKSQKQCTNGGRGPGSLAPNKIEPYNYKLSTKLEHGRRDKQRGADARRPGAAAKATRTAGPASSGTAAAADVGSAASTASASALPFRDAPHQAEQHEEERAK